jgi:hypothetical protein
VNVSGSEGVTPYSWSAMIRPIAAAASNP